MDFFNDSLNFNKKMLVRDKIAEQLGLNEN
jgi:hypothetical protein